MAQQITLTDLNHPLARIFASLTEAQLRSRVQPGEAYFIAESPKVIKVALDCGLQPMVIMCEERHIEGDARDIIARCPADMPLLTGERTMLAQLTGYTLTRGVLCAFRRPSEPKLEDICRDAKRLAVIDGVTDTTNIGAIFRSAAALGVDGVVLTRTSCDPFNRRSVRVSMGSVFLVPWTWLDGPIKSLCEMGFDTVAMALTDRSVSIDDTKLKSRERLAIILGTEGDGLDPQVIAEATFTARIPMSHNVDSLNVAAASAVAFWELRHRG